jgi:hypothetical protein
MRKGFRKGFVFFPEEEIGKAIDVIGKKIEQYKLPIRKIIIFLTFLIIVAMCLYPPWLRTYNLGTRQPALSTHKWSLPSEYGFIWDAPEYSSNERKFDVFDRSKPDMLVPWNRNFIITITATIDIRRLAIQCFVVLLVGGGLAYLWPEKKKPTEG